MTNSEIADTIKLTAQLMELHNENPFKIKSLNNASFQIDKQPVALENSTKDEIEKLPGIGKSIAAKIDELNRTGQLAELTEILSKTPSGLLEVLRIKGLGPKKVSTLWNDLGIESVGELYYACIENRLITLKGFGTKTQEAVKKSIEYIQANKGKFLYAHAEVIANSVVEELRKKHKKVELTGEIRRKNEIINSIDIVVESIDTIELPSVSIPIKINIIPATQNSFHSTLFETTATSAHLEKSEYNKLGTKNFASEEEIYKQLNLQYIEPELREGLNEIELAKTNSIPKLIETTDLKGVLHNHTTYSDGIHTLEEMATHCKQLGYEYLGICDHSQTAVYAGGLKPEAILKQHAEIDILNEKLKPFKIFKGIESDILNDGPLDYPEELLKTFDMVVASVHSSLKMDEERATKRLLKAIENPYTTILGHMSGRLLLSREGYPLDYKKIIDACAANKVVIELNANPHRLDIDWRWINYCLEKNVLISINPDAHEKDGFQDMYYGVCVARKGMVSAQTCLNAMSLNEISSFLKNK
ncbi:MAG: DNA polymerase/3'-5' exonuclease PolX [Bacteroidetes bacterium]|nr:DNA polymerase/3'-5' exonuclease PolX [Bacteroidota bacterium]